MLPHVAGIRFAWWLTQPYEPSDFYVRRDIEQVIQPTSVMSFQRLDQRPIDAPVGPRHSFRASTLNDR